MALVYAIEVAKGVLPVSNKAVGCVLLVILLIALVVGVRNYRVNGSPFVGDGSRPSSTSGASGSCEAKLKPQLEQCLEVQPEGNWAACRSAYLSELKECVG